MAAILSRGDELTLLVLRLGYFPRELGNSMAVDALAPSNSKPSGTIALNVKDKKDIIFHDAQFWVHLWSHCQEIIENSYIINIF